MSSRNELADVVWSVADLLRGHFRASESGPMILAFTVLRRIDCLRPSTGDDLDFRAANLRALVDRLDPPVREAFTSFDFDAQLTRLERAGVLDRVADVFAGLDLGAELVGERDMTALYEQLVRRFVDEAESDHFTPRDVLRLMAKVLLPEPIPAEASVFDPAAGTGGALFAVRDLITSRRPDAKVALFGQEVDPEAYAIGRAGSLLAGDGADIRRGDSLANDRHPHARFDYLITALPTRVNWRHAREAVEAEHARGFEGRFGAGLTRTGDGWLLFLQHMIHHMKDARDGGSRVAALSNVDPLHVGEAGSGESEIRRWILENDWLEAVIALPDHALQNTSAPTYIWVLAKGKPPGRAERVVLIDARDRWAKLRKSIGGKSKYLTGDQLEELTRLYTDAMTAAERGTQPMPAGTRLHTTRDFGYQRIVVEHPLRLRFEVTDAGLAGLRSLRVVESYAKRDRLLTALAAVKGTFATRAEFQRRLEAAIGDLDTLPGPVRRAVLAAVSKPDPAGEAQSGPDGTPLPDPDLRETVRLPLSESADDHLAHHVRPRSPDAWLDSTRSRIGYEIALPLFFTAGWGDRFESLDKVVRRVRRQAIGPGQPLLKMRDLVDGRLAAELEETSGREIMAQCAGGDLVGLGRNWHVLPDDFGTAFTDLDVFRPIGHNGRVLREWLSSTKVDLRQFGPLNPRNVPVPMDIVLDSDFDRLLADLDEGRRSAARTAARILPNVFDESDDDLQDVRRQAKSAAADARLVDDLVRPFEDPVWRAESTHPFHVAALARQYRIAVTPAERLERLLKLAEGIARTLGVVSLAIRIHRAGSFSSKLRGQFGNGATFGGWLRITRDLVDLGPVVELPELDDFLEPGGLYELLDGIASSRNHTSHSHGVRTVLQLELEHDHLEPRLIALLEQVNWLSALHWDQVDECQYVGNGYELIGLRLRGSHPHWEPFRRPVVERRRPKRIWVEGPSSGALIDLSPVTSVENCGSCQARELFLLDKISQGVAELRSLEEHSFERPVPSGEDTP